jgi:hypothetical protein
MPQINQQVETNFHDLILQTYERKKHDRIVFQPRLMLWFNRNGIGGLTPDKYKKNERVQKFVPERYIGKNILEIHRDIDSSVRYSGETMGISYFYHQSKAGAKIIHRSGKLEDGSNLLEVETPVGKLQQKVRDNYAIDKWIKKPEDFKVAKYLVENDELCYNQFMFEGAEEELGKIGVPQCYYFRSPYQKCILEWLGFERTTIFLRKYPNEMEDFMRFLEQWDRNAYKVILKSDLKILNFGENIDCQLSPPRVFEKYHLPYYKERVKWVHDAGKFCHIHMDGHIHDLLPYLKDLPFDGIEALTPEPQGDCTLEELRDSIGNKILLDGIPATLFMLEFPEERLYACVHKLLEYFSPNLIVGVSDELPENTDGRRLKKVGEIVANYHR